MMMVMIIIIIIIIIDTTISGGRNMIKEKAEKILKYKDLTIEIRRTWNVEAKSDTGNNKGITKSYRQYLSNRPGKQKINELQEKALLCASRIFRMVLM